MVREIASQLRKDFRVEFRNPFALNVSLSFAVISTLALSLAAGGIPLSPKMQAVLFWIIMFFCAMNSLSHVFVREEDQGTALFLRLNSRPAAVLTAKLLFNGALFLLLQIVIAPLFLFFLQLDVKSAGAFIAAVLAGGLALSSSVTVMGAIAARSGGRAALFTVISFPVVLPVLWTAIHATALSLERGAGSGADGLLFLLAFSGVMVAVSYLLFESIWTEE